MSEYRDLFHFVLEVRIVNIFCLFGRSIVKRGQAISAPRSSRSFEHTRYRLKMLQIFTSEHTQDTQGMVITETMYLHSP